MMHILSDTLVFIAASQELMILVKTAILLAFGLIFVWANRSARASVRHLLLTCTFAVILLLPIAVLFAPSFHVEVEDPTAQVVSTELVPAPLEAPAITQRVTNARDFSAGNSQAFSISLRTSIWLVWGLGALLVLTKLAFSLIQLRIIRRTGIPSLETNQVLDALRSDAGISRRVEVLLHDDVDVPFTFGLLRPVVLLPSDASTWNNTELRRVLVHELEHIKRSDWIVQVTTRAVCAFYWFQPLVWIAWRKICLEAERACDDAVVTRHEQADYAEQLVSLARRLSNPLAPPLLSLANRSDLSRRVSSILDNEQARGRAGTRWTVIALVLSAAIVATAAPGLMITRTYAQAVQATKKIPAKSRALNRALLEASEAGELKDMENLLDAGADVNGVVEGDGTALIVAAREGNKGAVLFLLRRGADPNVPAKGDGSPLIMASKEGHEEIVKLLLDAGAQVNQIVEGDENPIIQASGSGKLSVVKLLVSHGADVNSRAWSGETDGEWRTPLMMARRGGHTAVIEYLISAGARE